LLIINCLHVGTIAFFELPLCNVFPEVQNVQRYNCYAML